MYFVVCIQAASLLLIISAQALTNDTITINVPEGKALTRCGDCSVIVMQSFYKKFQPGALHLAVPSKVYLKVPGLSFAFNHATPLVYRLSFEAECRISENAAVFQLEFMYDDNLLRNERQLVPNNGHDRPEYVPLYWYPPLGYAHHAICIHSEIVHVSSGTHLIDVGFRLLDLPFTNKDLVVSKATLTIELTQYNPNVNHGLPIITPDAPIG